MDYICAELRKPVEDTVYRKLLSQRAVRKKRRREENRRGQDWVERVQL